MKPHLRAVGILAALALAAASASPALAARQPVPRGGGGGSAHYGGSSRGAVPSRGTAHGTAHYGYGYGGYHGYPGGWWGYPYYGYGYGYPYYGWWGPGWSVGLNFGWGWPYYNGYYGPYYDPYSYGPAYVISGAPTGPAVIETAVAPKSATVLLDGTAVGYAKDYNGRWDELRISPGPHTLEFRDAGHRSLVVELNASPGARYRIDRELAPGSGEDRVSVGPAKRAPSEEAAGSAPATPPAAAASGVPRGLLRVRVQPGDAGVYLDGEFLGLASELGQLHGAIPVATGEHKIEVVRPGFAAQVKKVAVGADATAEIEVDLTKD